MERCLTASGLQMDRALLQPTLMAIFSTLGLDPAIDTRYCTEFCTKVNNLNNIMLLNGLNVASRIFTLFLH